MGSYLRKLQDICNPAIFQGRKVMFMLTLSRITDMLMCKSPVSITKLIEQLSKATYVNDASILLMILVLQV